MTDLFERAPGDLVASFTAEPITRHALALYAGASGDYNPIHVDIDYAREAGMPDVFAQGMLVMGYLARCVAMVRPPERIRELSTRFISITRVGDAITCSARLIGIEVIAGEKRARLELLAVDQTGEIRLKGEAVVAV